jgi:uncharacterized protein (TIGR00288 family)
MKEQEFSNIAVLIDAENISSNYIQEIVNKIAVYGKISVRKIYSDWTDNKMNSWKNILKDYSLVPIQQFNNTGSKNVSDFTLVIDAMDLLHDRIYDCFCIVSSDSDFTRLAQRIREKGKIVIGLGERKTTRAFINACNEFIYLNEENNTNEIQKANIEQKYDESNVKTSDEANDANEIKKEDIEQECDESNNKILDEVNEKQDVTHRGTIRLGLMSRFQDLIVKRKNADHELHELIRKAVEELKEDNGWTLMAKISPYINRIKPDFNSRRICVDNNLFSRLKDYFKYYRDIYILNKENTLVKIKKRVNGV